MLFTWEKGDGHAIQTEGSLQASRLSESRARRTKVLRGTQEDASGRNTVSCGTRIQQPMETGEQEVLGTSSTLRGVPATWHRNACDGCGSHHSAPRRSEALLGQVELAGAV